MEGDGKETGTGKGKMSCDHSHVPHALPHGVHVHCYVQRFNKDDLPSRARDWLARARESALGNIEVLARTLDRAA